MYRYQRRYRLLLIHKRKFQPPTAHRDDFQQALDRSVDKISALVPRFGLRNPRMGIPGTTRYAFCIRVYA